MPDYVGESKKPAGGDRETLPTGPQNAISVRKWDIGYQENSYKGKKKAPKHEIVIMWEIEAKYTKGNFAGKHMVISKRFTKSLGYMENGAWKPSNLYKAIKSWRNGVDLTAEERKQFDLDSLMLKPWQLNIEQNAKASGNTVTEIGAYLPPPRKDCPKCAGKPGDKACPQCKGRGRVLAMTRWTPDIPADYTPDWIRDLIDKQLPPPSEETGSDNDSGVFEDEE
jgi:hypothetical protein